MSRRTAQNLDVKMIIRTKCHEFDHDEWCGYLQPAEIMALVAAGYHPYVDSDGNDDRWVVERAADAVKKGIGGGSWYYFNIIPRRTK